MTGLQSISDKIKFNETLSKSLKQVLKNIFNFYNLEELSQNLFALSLIIPYFVYLESNWNWSLRFIRQTNSVK